MGLAKYYLPALFTLFTAFAGSAIWSFARANGTLDLLNEFGEKKLVPYGDNRVPMRTTYTGIEAIDNICVVLVVFFAPVVDLSNASLVLHTVAFGGVLGSAWVLVVLESWRAGNSRKFFAL